MNKVALVLGGNGGIGSSAVKRLAEDGFQVCATYFKHKDKLKEIETELSSNEISVFQCDLTNEDEVNKTINFVSYLAFICSLNAFMTKSIGLICISK